MNLIKVEDRSDLKKVLKKAENPTVVLISDVIKPEDIKKGVPVFQFSPILIPTTTILNEYLDNGITHTYEKQYYAQLQKPNRLFLLNEMLYRMIATDSEIFFVISEDEVEYQYLKMLNRFLQAQYHCKMNSVKKYMKGENFQGKEDEFKKVVKQFRDSLGKKLVDSGYVIYELLGIICTKSSLKEFPKETQRRIKEILRGESDYE